ncbi:serpin family protein [Streptomyces sp. NPDC014864]|uniref:serpin family protein n=1 Tax=Streptomyces sp. NPDC014864 TaxID=3364924 RepID=UPI0036FBE0EA
MGTADGTARGTDGTAQAAGGGVRALDDAGRAVGGAVRAVGELTVRWAHGATEGTAFSALGVWPLLAFLADGAAGAARTELAQALGTPAEEAAARARELLVLADGVSGLDAALGLWTKRTLELRPEWRAGLPTQAHGVLTGDPDDDRDALDAWARRLSGGLVDRMPVTLTPDTQMVLASALALRTDWQHPFSEVPVRPDAGPWRDRTLAGLHRRSPRVERVGVADTPAGPVTRLVVTGDNGIDVHLLLGEERMTRGQVLEAGVGLLGGAHRLVLGTGLPHGNPGPGLRVEEEHCTAPQPPVLDVRTVGFEVRADHDLLDLDRLFGLSTAKDTGRGHFPGVSAFPLAVGSAGQSVVARFGPLGFRAAAVTAVAAAAGGIPQFRHTTTVVRAVFDRPFGFLAVNRGTGLVLVAGWVTDPAPYPDRSPFGPR